MSGLPGTFDVQLRFLSDWHIGAGRGWPATVIAVVRRDADGLPFVPAKTLTGVWRNATEAVALTLDGGATSGPWAQWVDWIFGSRPARGGDPTGQSGSRPRPAAVGIGPARAEQWLQSAVRSKPALLQAAVTLRSGVELNTATGGPIKGSLRIEERALRGSLMIATVRVLDVEDEFPLAGELLLRAGARLIDALGGKGNRGAGRVLVMLPGVADVRGLDVAGPGETTDAAVDLPSDDRLAELLANTALLANPGPPPAPRVVALLAHVAAQSGQHRVIRIALEAVTPVVIPEAMLRNSVATRQEIPGTMLLPALLSRLERAGGIGLADVRAGDAVPAYVGPGGAMPALPVPLVWRRDGSGSGPEVVNTSRVEIPSQAQAAQVRGWIVRVGPDQWQRVDVGVSVSTHTVVHDTASAGTVFTVYGIRPGTALVTDVVVPADARLRLAIGDELRFGRSKKDDYGLVRVSAIGKVDRPGENQAGSGVRPRLAHNQNAPDMLLSILCVSDVLLRDERLAPDPSPARLGAVLGAALGVVLSILPDPTGGSADTEPEGGLFRHTAVTTVRREGFVRRWGRPRGTLVALGAGSVVTFRSDSAPQPQAVARVERDGIGERVAEGFGRVLVNPAELSVARPTVLSDGDLGTSTADSQDRAIGTMSTRSPTPSQWAGSAHPIELNAWRNEIRRRAMQAALQPEDVLPGIRKPSRAQLGALRGQLKRLSLPNGQALVREWFDAQQVRHHRLNWGSDTLVRAKSLLLDAPDEVWSRLRLDGAQPALVLAEGREPLLRTALQTEAVTVLVVEVLRVVRDSRIDRGASTNHGPLTNQLGQE